MRHSEELDILWISKWVNSFDQIFKDDKSTNVLCSFMTNMIHTAHNSIDDGRHTCRACLALKAELPMGHHRGELTEVCSGIIHWESGGSVVEEEKAGIWKNKGNGVERRNWP